LQLSALSDAFIGQISCPLSPSAHPKVWWAILGVLDGNLTPILVIWPESREESAVKTRKKVPSAQEQVRTKAKVEESTEAKVKRKEPGLVTSPIGLISLIGSIG
jgi:hypothetical protein